MNSSIHMLFMNYAITVIWLDRDLVVVDKVLANHGISLSAQEASQICG